jgi:Zn-dependent membrane protease YugP
MEEILLFVLILIIPLISQLYVTSTYNKYKQIKNSQNLSGYDIARKILDENKLNELLIVEIKGELRDHYDPIRKVVRLSSNIYHDEAIASIAVAAHEVGHALQDKDKYIFNKVRNIILPFINFTSKAAYILLLIGIFLEMINFIEISIALMIFSVFFQIITLPIEFNASKRAEEELRKLKMFSENELNNTKKMLNSAALTYVASLLTTLLNMLRLILMIDNRRD